MDGLMALVLSAIALFGIVASVAGVESRDGFARAEGRGRPSDETAE